MLTLAGPEGDHVRNRLGIAGQVCLGLPRLQIRRPDPVQQRVDQRPVGRLERLRTLFEHPHHARPGKPGAGFVILGGGNLVQQMTARVVDAQLVELPQDGEVANLVGRQLDVGGAQDERMIALVPRPSRNVADSASVLATITPGTFMTSSWKRAALNRLICSSTPTSTFPPWCPHFLAPGFWPSMW